VLSTSRSIPTLARAERRPSASSSQTALAAQVWITESKGETPGGTLGKPFTKEMSTLRTARDPRGERVLPRGTKYVTYVIINDAFGMFWQLGFIYRFLLTC
jgi:hypothetical protein